MGLRASVRAVPGSRLVLKHDVSHDPAVQGPLLRAFAGEGIAGPGAPPRKFALGLGVQVGAAVEGILGDFVHGNRAFHCNLAPLNPIPSQ